MEPTPAVRLKCDGIKAFLQQRNEPNLQRWDGHAMTLETGVLAIDVGSGTQDILVWSPEVPMENCPKMILPSATTIMARQIREATQNRLPVFLHGKTMGGGPCTSAVRRHLEAGLEVFALPEAARTFHDNLEKVARMGVRIVEERPRVRHLQELETGDVHLKNIAGALALFRVSLPDTVAVAVQDHGFSPEESNRAFRFQQWTRLLQSGEGLESLLFMHPPAHLTRMRAVAEAVSGAWVTDTGPPAILGALLDPWVKERKQQGVTIVNIGNEHTVAALVRGEKIWGIYEHHTALLDPEKLSVHLDRFRKGNLSNQEVFDDMGHGCHALPGTSDRGPFEHLSITGPNRERFAALGGQMAAPYGDMMLTGCFGLVEALRRRMESRD
jgi:uncharacterized protein (DUF1786 family)